MLIINAGSSSIKFAFYSGDCEPILEGIMEDIGTRNSRFRVQGTQVPGFERLTTESGAFEQAIDFFVDWLEKQECFADVSVAGHRLVFGMKHRNAELITPDLISQLKALALFDPEHLPVELKLIEALKARYKQLEQVACFDTAFHQTMPPVATRLSIPLEHVHPGLQRYGFHGLSYAFLVEELRRLNKDEISRGKLILAHLGNGASLAAVKDGECIDTTMGFTPSSGIVMGTRSGDIDPGIPWYLMRFGKMSPDEYYHIINHKSGLLGISGSTGDMRELIEKKTTDPRAAAAVDMFCYQAKKYIGSYAAALEGLDTLVFSGGIGEHSPEVRSQVCDGLGFLGIELDEVRNMNNDPVISSPASRVVVRVIATNEQLMIARLVSKIMNAPSKN